MLRKVFNINKAKVKEKKMLVNKILSSQDSDLRVRTSPLQSYLSIVGGDKALSMKSKTKNVSLLWTPLILGGCGDLPSILKNIVGKTIS